MGQQFAREEQPQHEVTIAGPFAVSRFAVTFDQWDACVAGGGCDNYRPGDASWGRGTRPVIYVNSQDAQNYVDWLNRLAGTRSYRLLSEAEFEYCRPFRFDYPIPVARRCWREQCQLRRL
jgi:formylglycine-generating enzyme required for sulfatase activity